MEYQVNEPYPKVRVEKQNKEYALLLMDDYAGMVSELTAITQYSYQHFINLKNPIIANALAQIAKVEMRHLELLGETIFLLGIKPKYSDWQSGNVCYETDIPTILKADILSEEEAIARYQKHKEIIKDKYIKDMLARIIKDEERHIECFEILLKNFNNKQYTCDISCN